MGLNNFSKEIHSIVEEAGWWDEETRNNPFVVPLKISRIHGEVSEALEGHRRDLMDDKLPHRSAIEVELADAMILILDLAGFLDLDIQGAIDEKLEYGKTREDHTTEGRAKKNGKRY